MTGASLERWRIENGLNAVEGTEAFGLPIAKWYKVVGKELKQPLSDLVLGLTLSLYTNYPAAAPTQGRPEIRGFYEWLGFKDNPSDKNEFARLIGREPPSVYRLLGPQGKPGRPLIRYIEGLLQLRLDPQSTRRIMEQIADEVIVTVDPASS